MQTATQIIMSITDLHSEQNNVEDKAKFLTHQQRSFLATAVKRAPMNSALQHLMHIQDSHTKKIEVVLENSLQCIISSEWLKITEVTVEGIEETTELFSLKRLSGSRQLWKGTKWGQKWTVWCMFRLLQILLYQLYLCWWGACQWYHPCLCQNSQSAQLVFVLSVSCNKLTLEGDMILKVSSTAINTIAYCTNLQDDSHWMAILHSWSKSFNLYSAGLLWLPKYKQGSWPISTFQQHWLWA